MLKAMLKARWQCSKLAGSLLGGEYDDTAE